MGYYDMIKAAILADKSRSGTSGVAIKKFIEATYPTVAFKQHLLRTALKTAVGAGKLVQDKQTFKLSAAEKKPPAKPKKKVVKKKAPKKKA
eukprot:CAMPEP_0182522278 /NCGR_PEP_ID=MMETSP1323-20130603/176_1 /TAXON_ID=236787 /ORGANISM="Florenciella parvula, Strain RCC1693" /LENGTH=90 /DNA_ID=CAMNT_0024730373 /DNA_START=48 /DNA_END=316 /DNA_ORIENTATION=+